MSRNPFRPWHYKLGPGPEPIPWWAWAMLGAVLALATIALVALIVAR